MYCRFHKNQNHRFNNICVRYYQITTLRKIWTCLKVRNTASAGMKEGNVLFNDRLNTFYLQLYGIGHMIKDHSDSEREKHSVATKWATFSKH